MRFLKNKPLIASIAIVVVMLVLISVSSAGNALSQAASTVSGAVVPVQKALYQVSSALSGDSADSSADPAADETNSTAMAYEELVAENERLRAMLEYKETNVTQELKVAQITGKEPGNWFEVFTIDIGAGEGIAKGMPVVTPDGLVGRVEEAGVGWSKVMTILDARSSVAAIMERTRDTGVVKGMIGSDDLTASLTMNYLPLDTDIIEGDTVLTSGYDEVYPKGLIVGTVTSSVDQSGGKLVEVEPSVDFRRLEEVMVIVSSQEETSQGVVASSTQDALPAPSASEQPQASASAGTEEESRSEEPAGEGSTSEPTSSSTP